MAIRSAVFDRWLKGQIEKDSTAAVQHIGCRMDSRIECVGCGEHRWQDFGFPEVIELRKKYYTETGNYKMTAGDARKTD